MSHDVVAQLGQQCERDGVAVALRIRFRNQIVQVCKSARLKLPHQHARRRTVRQTHEISDHATTNLTHRYHHYHHRRTARQTLVALHNMLSLRTSASRSSFCWGLVASRSSR